MALSMYIMTVWDETPCGFLDTIISDDPLTMIFKVYHILSTIYEILAQKFTVSQFVHNIGLLIFVCFLVFTVFLDAFRRNVRCRISEIAAGAVFLHVRVAEQSIVS